MAKADASEKVFNEQLVARTRKLRIASERTQAEMAALLNISVDRYKKYEKRSPLPHYLVPSFCAILDVSVSFFLTGREERRGQEAA